MIHGPTDAFEKGIAIIYQETSLFEEMTGWKTCSWAGRGPGRSGR